MNFKKRVNGSWVDTPNYIHNTSTDTIATLPTVIYPTGTTATVGLKGNTLQSSIPSPASPVMPQGTGERTGNLFDESTIEVGGLDINTGAEAATSSRRRSGFIKVTPSTTYTLSRVIDETKSNLWVIGYDANKNAISDSSGTRPTVLTSIGEQNTISVFDTTTSTEYIRWYVTANGSYSDIMLNIGSTALPYEPYGYKIPISSNSSTTPVYLGEVETTRKVKKLVLDGTENWSGYSSSVSGVGVSLLLSDMLSNSRSNGFCTHFSPQYSPSQSVINGVTFGAGNKSLYLTFSVASATALNLTDTTSVKTWLATQYAAGTPVTVWYVLAEPTTGIVNEPLRKIDDYADEVSGITIPTIAGANTLSVDTTLQPSEVSVNYKGWHPVANVYEYDSNYTIATMQALTIAQLQTHTISDLQGGEWS